MDISEPTICKHHIVDKRKSIHHKNVYCIEWTQHLFLSFYDPIKNGNPISETSLSERTWSDYHIINLDLYTNNILQYNPALCMKKKTNPIFANKQNNVSNCFFLKLWFCIFSWIYRMKVAATQSHDSSDKNWMGRSEIPNNISSDSKLNKHISARLKRRKDMPNIAGSKTVGKYSSNANLHAIRVYGHN